MLLEIKEIKSSMKQPWRKKKVSIFSCDQCNEVFEKKYSKFIIDRNHHFCSLICTKNASVVGGILRNVQQETCIKKYGVKTPLESKKIRDEITNNVMQKYGVQNVFSLKETHNKAKKTNLEKYGVEYASQTREFRERVEKTNIEKYGSACVFQNNDIAKKRMNTMLKKYGTVHALQVNEIKSKLDYKIISAKRHQTMKKNGTYGKSKAEDLFYEFLLESFPNKTIIRQEIVNGWSIDFKIDEMHIQFDGVYWHGLDRPLQEVISSKNPRDKVILKTYHRDRKQDKWFEENNLKLIRITDKEFENMENLYARL